MDTLMTVRDEQGQPLTDDEVVCYSMYGFAGSSSYMSRVIAFMLYELVKHPDLLAQVRTEIASALAHGLTNASDVRSLRLLQATYHETLRFHPVSQGMPCLAANDFVYHGKLIRKGDVTVLSQVPMSFSSCPFHRAERFKPDRCLEPRMEHRKENAFHPFGIGHRTCTAMGLVEQMALTQVAALVHHFDFELSPKNYQLRLTVKPLPAPDRHFGLRILGPRSHAIAQTTPRPFLEEHALTKVAGHDDPAVLDLLSQASPVHAYPDEVILREGDPADAFYLVMSGQVQVTRRTDQGSDTVIATLGACEYFGELGLLTGHPRNASVIAIGNAPVELLRTDAAGFARLIEAGGGPGGTLAMALTRRMG
jgi:hypothetical protein